MQPFSISVPAIHNYYCICPEANREREEVSYFIDWLIAEAGRGSDIGRLSPFRRQWPKGSIDDVCNRRHHIPRLDGSRTLATDNRQR